MKRSPMKPRSTALRKSDGNARLTVPVPKPCKACKVPFVKSRPMQKACSPACAMALVESAKAKKDRAETKEKLAKLRTRSEWMKLAQEAFNAFIRARDANEPCISCKRHHAGAYHAGHYLTTGARPELRFDEANVHKQCAPCNLHLHGNLVLYRINLIEKVGLQEVERLEGPSEPAKHSIDDLKQLIATYRAKRKALEKP